MNRPISHPVVILGATLEGWLAAALLADRLKPLGIQVLVIPTWDQAEAPVALTTPPSMSGLHQQLKLDELDIVRACDGSFRLGTKLSLTKDDQDSFILTYGPTGETRNGITFLHHWLRAQREGQVRPFSSYNLAAAMAVKSKFTPAHKDMGPYGVYEYGLHLDGRKYQDYLRRCAQHYGAMLIESQVGNDQYTKNRTDLQLRLQNGEEINYSLLIDARGVQSLHDLKTAPLPGGDLFMRDAKPVGQLSLTRCEGSIDDYSVRIPLKKISPSIRFQRNAEGDLETITNTWRENPWSGHCVAIGRSACDLEPLHDPFMNFLPLELNTLLERLPFSGGEEWHRREYNRVTASAYERFADLQCLTHLLLSKTEEHEDVPQNLRRKINQFKNRGRVVTYDHELMTQDMQLQLMLGSGLVPDRYDALADIPTSEQLKEYVSSTLKTVRMIRDQVPDQEEALIKSGIWTSDKAEIQA